MASALITAVRTIEQRIAAQWQASDGDALTKIAWPGVAFTPPEPKFATTKYSWLKVDIVWGEGQLSTKNGRNTIVGILELGVFVPDRARGLKTLHTLTDTARDIANRLETSGVRFGVPSGPVDVPEDSGWLHRAISVPFTVDETVT